MQLFGKTNIDFQGKRHLAMTISGIVILISLVSLILHGGPNYSIDFTGGLSMTVRITEPQGKPPATEDVVRGALFSVNLGDSEVKMSRSPEGEDLLIRVKEEGRFRPPEAAIRLQLEKVLAERWHLVLDENLSQDKLPDFRGISHIAIEANTTPDTLMLILNNAEVDNPRYIQHKTINDEPVWILMGEGRDVASLVRKALVLEFSDYKIDFRSIDRVGPRIGAELRMQALLAIFAALGLIVIYLWWRFELLFGVAAVIALFHDVMITLGLFSLLNIEISITIIGAFLTLVGYSLNDTIVVFDRIRENIRRYKDASFSDVVNRSINDTLSRTIITGLTTLFVLLVLFFNGGEVLHNFALALVAGIIIGTYSSIYIASPILIEWSLKSGKATGSKLKKKGK